MKETEKILDSSEDKDKQVKILKDKCDFLYKTKQPFTLLRSGSTYELQSNIWNTKAHKSGFTVQDLHFIKSVKQYIIKNKIALNFIHQDFQLANIQYIEVKRFEAGEVLENLLCVDIDGAYWKTAHLLKIIDDKLYKRGLDVNKVVRLAALGSLAKSKEVWKFDGSDFSKQASIRSSETENLWFAICKKVSQVMQEIKRAIGDNFVFYWVDGVYIKYNSKAFDAVTKILVKHGYTSHFDLIPQVVFTDDGFEVQGATVGDLKKFSWHNGKQNKPVTEYIENRRLLKIANDVLWKKKKK